MIGIGITTHNRYETFSKTLVEIKRYAPKDAKIVVVDDASDIPVPEATFRFDTNVGIAAGKNKCMELLDECDHLFLRKVGHNYFSLLREKLKFGERA